MHQALAFAVQGLAAYTWSEHPDLVDRAEALETEVWPEYNRHGDVVGAHWARLGETSSDFQFVVVDEATDEVVAEAHSIPARGTGRARACPRASTRRSRQAWNCLASAKSRRPCARSRSRSARRARGPG